MTILDMFKTHAVTDCASVSEFLKKYYKQDRYTGRGKEYANIVLKSHEKDVEETGICIISNHNSVTGKVVAFVRE